MPPKSRPRPRKVSWPHGGDIAAIKRAYKIVYRQGLTAEEAIETMVPIVAEHPQVQMLVDSLLRSKRGIVR